MLVAFSDVFGAGAAVAFVLQPVAGAAPLSLAGSYENARSFVGACATFVGAGSVRTTLGSLRTIVRLLERALAVCEDFFHPEFQALSL